MFSVYSLKIPISPFSTFFSMIIEIFHEKKDIFLVFTLSFFYDHFKMTLMIDSVSRRLPVQIDDFSMPTFF